MTHHAGSLSLNRPSPTAPRLAAAGRTPASAAVHAGVPRFLQAKLPVSQPGDPYEQEADRVADQVMRMPAPALQRSCTACASEPAPCPSCTDEEAAPEIQRKAETAPPTPSTTAAAPDAGAGQALDAGARGFFEPRFGQAFSDVRVHDGAAADSAARSFGARAYALGSDLVFAHGEYAPGTDAGRRLLAHELTHVVQQRGAAAQHVQRVPGDGADTADAAQPADACHGRTLAEQEFDVFIHAVSVQHGSQADLPMLYLELKRTRSCFPSYSEADFLDDVPKGALYSDEQRPVLASGQTKDVAADDRRLAWRESQKPFAGYSVSGFDPSNRFTTKSKLNELGYTPTASHPGASELSDDPSKAQKSFAAADVLVFSGHQYAQYQVPGLWGDDSGKVSFDARTLAGPLNNVRLIVSTSCATICRDPAAVWSKLFPKAVFLGYKKSAPLNGGTMANKFASNLPKDLLLDSGGVAAAAVAWKSAIRSNHRDDKSTQAGVLDVAANQIEYWDGKAFHSIAANSEGNQCRVKGDYSADHPDPGTWDA